MTKASGMPGVPNVTNGSEMWKVNMKTSRDRESVTTSFVLPLFLLGIARIAKVAINPH